MCVVTRLKFHADFQLLNAAVPLPRFIEIVFSNSSSGNYCAATAPRLCISSRLPRARPAFPITRRGGDTRQATRQRGLEEGSVRFPAERETQHRLKRRGKQSSASVCSRNQTERDVKIRALECRPTFPFVRRIMSVDTKKKKKKIRSDFFSRFSREEAPLRMFGALIARLPRATRHYSSLTFAVITIFTCCTLRRRPNVILLVIINSILEELRKFLFTIISISTSSLAILLSRNKRRSPPLIGRIGVT